MDCAVPAVLRQPCLLSRPPALLLPAVAPQLISRRRYPSVSADRPSLQSSVRCAALNFQQEWLEERQEDEWKAAEKVVQTADSKSQRLSLHILQAAIRAVYMGLKMTALAVRLAKGLVADVRRALWWQERQAAAQHRAALAAQEAQRRQQLAAVRERAAQAELFTEARDAQFIALLHTMDDSSIPLETKWSGIQQHVGSKQEFGKHMSQLFALAGESSRAVQGLAENSSAFWKSAHTQQVIAQEEALKRHLYLQMLNAAPAAS